MKSRLSLFCDDRNYSLKDDCMTTPPVDTNGEMERANRTLRRMRRELVEKADLPTEWQRWVAESIVAPYRESDDEESDRLA